MLDTVEIHQQHKRVTLIKIKKDVKGMLNKR